MLLPNFTNKYPLVDIIKIIQNQAIFAPLEGQGLMWRRKEAGDGLETQHILTLSSILTVAHYR